METTTFTQERPLLSIIVPVYNTKAYVKRCVDSITAQTYQNLEILLIDDGSTDGSGALCDELAAADSRIRVFHKANGGSSSARNLGLQAAKGAYFGFVDSDDFIDEAMYEALYAGIVAKGVSMAQIGRDEIDEKGNLLPNICEPPLAPTLYTAEAFLKELLLHKGDCSFCTKLMHRDLFKDREFPVGLLNEDFRLLMEMLPDAKSLVSLPGQTYHVFYRLGSNSRKENKNEFSRVFGDCVDNADLAMAMVQNSYPNLVPVALRFGVFQRLEYLLHIPILQMQKDNVQYREIVGWMRKHYLASMKNPILTFKNKSYHTLFAIAPKTLRVLHARLKGIG